MLIILSTKRKSWPSDFFFAHGVQFPRFFDFSSKFKIFSWTFFGHHHSIHLWPKSWKKLTYMVRTAIFLSATLVIFDHFFRVFQFSGKVHADIKLFFLSLKVPYRYLQPWEIFLSWCLSLSVSWEMKVGILGNWGLILFKFCKIWTFKARFLKISKYIDTLIFCLQLCVGKMSFSNYKSNYVACHIFWEMASFHFLGSKMTKVANFQTALLTT